jgi:hypothetical protein
MHNGSQSCEPLFFYGLRVLRQSKTAYGKSNFTLQRPDEHAAYASEACRALLFLQTGIAMHGSIVTVSADNRKSKTFLIAYFSLHI